MKSFICMIAAGLFLLPAGVSAEKKDIHEVMMAEEHHGSTAPAERASDEESILDEEMDELGDEPAGSHEEERTSHPAHEAAAAQESAAKEPAPQDGGHGIGIDPSVSVDSASNDDAYGTATAIDPVTLADGDWAFVEGDERRGWFFDRTRMQRNSDGTISYWQLILYNELGRVQFARAMHDTDYEQLRYTLQRRVLDLRQNTVRTYEIRAYDGAHALIAESARDGHPAEIRPNTMAEKEREAVRKAVRGRKQK